MASAILWVSSRFLTALPRLFAASISSPDRRPGHGRLVAAARGGDEPADGERAGAIGAHFDRHLIGGAADAARAHFDARARRCAALRGRRRADPAWSLLDGVERAIDDAFGGGLLAVIHQAVHELGEDEIAELGVRDDFAAFCAVAAGHRVLSLLRTLGAVERTALACGP